MLNISPQDTASIYTPKIIMKKIYKKKMVTNIHKYFTVFENLHYYITYLYNITLAIYNNLLGM